MGSEVILIGYSALQLANFEIYHETLGTNQSPKSAIHH